jgi:hypothetical protein
MISLTGIGRHAGRDAIARHLSGKSYKNLGWETGIEPASNPEYYNMQSVGTL